MSKKNDLALDGKTEDLILDSKQNVCIVNSNNIFIDLVPLFDDESLPYELKDGENILDIPPPLPSEEFLTHRWDGKKWVVDMTPEEIEQATKAKYEGMGFSWPPKPPEQSETELAIFELAEILALQEEAIFELAQGLEGK